MVKTALETSQHSKRIDTLRRNLESPNITLQAYARLLFQYIADDFLSRNFSKATFSLDATGRELKPSVLVAINSNMEGLPDREEGCIVFGVFFTCAAPVNDGFKSVDFPNGLDRFNQEEVHKFAAIFDVLSSAGLSPTIQTGLNNSGSTQIKVRVAIPADQLESAVDQLKIHLGLVSSPS